MVQRLVPLSVLMAQRRRPAAASAAPPQTIPLTDTEEPDWGSEIEAFEEVSLHRKSSKGTRLDASMEEEEQASKKGAKKSNVLTKEVKETEQSTTKGKVSTKTISKKEQLMAITGLNAEFPTLGMTLSADPVLNMSWTIHGRLLVHKWKQMVWMLRARAAVTAEGRQYRRHPRWLAMMFAREVAALWGHLGGATRTLQGPRGPPLMK